MINVYKETGFTSFDVVAKLRGILKIKKIGHTGTLDPDATGVLPVCLGKATRVCDLLTRKDKTYIAVMHLGMVTDTQDGSGKILETRKILVQEPQIRQVIRSFVGKQQQIPPMYSAIKVNGQRLYEMARKGVEIERQPREIIIYDIRIRQIDLPRIEMEVHCSAGTYIRTLCHDIGEQLGCGACMESLVRTEAAGFRIKDSLTLGEIQAREKAGTLDDFILPVDQVFGDYPKLVAKPSATPLLENGNGVSGEFLQEIIPTDAGYECKYAENGDKIQKITDNSDKNIGTLNGPVRMYMADGRFVGVFEKKQGIFRPIKMFLE
jgi:tRNA pseudouridine55 synthase